MDYTQLIRIMIPVMGAVSILVAVFLYQWLHKRISLNEKSNDFSLEVQKGSVTYLRRLFQALSILAGIIALIIFFVFGWRTALAYLTGSICGSLAAWVGMHISTRANAKVAWAAKKGIQEAFPVGFFAGAIMGLSVVGLALLGMSLLYYIFGDPNIVLGFSFGASSLALLAKAGGGIYTKTADIGADLVGKVECDLKEDDSRNPAVIADNVGDNVGDVAGMGADIFDSYVASVIAVMILGNELFEGKPAYILFPLLLGAMGIFASLMGMVFVKFKKSKDPGSSLNTGTIATTIVFALFAFFSTWILQFDQPLGILIPTIAGLLAGIVIGFTSDHFTDIKQKAVQDTAKMAQTGPAIVILEGFSYGLLSILPSILGICTAMLIAWFSAVYFGISGVYGVSVAAVGMLAITGMIVSADAYGPIVDNAKGCAVAGGEDKQTIAVCDELDAAGNTAKAITKGFAIGAAALTVLALFAVYTETVGIHSLDLQNPGVMIGLFLGGIMPPLFSALTILSVGRNAFIMVHEIRRQFKEIPGLIEGKVKPDSQRCIDIATKGALKELLLPGVLSFLVPLAVGTFLGVNALGGFLAGSIVVGIIFALFMANAGGLWDNAKKYIEEGAFGGIGSEAHKSAVVGDTVGDPFKDTAGPSINTLITVMSLVATIFGPLLARIALLKL